MLYIEREVWIKDPEHGGIPCNLVRPQEKLWDGQCHQIKRIIDKVKWPNLRHAE